MGRLPVIQFREGLAKRNKVGRDHNTYGFSMWVAGGGFRKGHIHGQTDEFSHYAVDGVIDTGYANNGILAGLVSITAPCPVVSLWGALIIGAVAAPVYLGSSKLLVKLGVDDVVDAFPVHGACGAWGVIAASLFATEYYYKIAYYSDDDRASECAGVFYGGDGGALGSACLFVLFIIAWVGGTMTLLFTAMHLTIGIRCSPEEEAMGMDDSKHGGSVLTDLEMSAAQVPEGTEA